MMHCIMVEVDTVQCVAGNVHLFDTLSTTWSRVAPNVLSASKLVPVRHTSCMLEGTLHVIGGGAMCFSFGSTFSEVSPICISELHRRPMHIRSDLIAAGHLQH